MGSRFCGVERQHRWWCEWGGGVKGEKLRPVLCLQRFGRCITLCNWAPPTPPANTHLELDLGQAGRQAIAEIDLAAAAAAAAGASYRAAQCRTSRIRCHHSHGHAVTLAHLK